MAVVAVVVEVVCSAMAVDRLWRGRLQRDGCRLVVVEVAFGDVSLGAI